MTITARTRWTLIGTGAVLFVLFGPLALIVAGNLGEGILDHVLNRTPTSKELLGGYKLEVPWGKSTLNIQAEGTFQQEVSETGKPAHRVSGRWNVSEHGPNYLTLDFRPFGMVWDDDHVTTTHLYVISFYKPHFGATYGTIDDDLGEKFVRQDETSQGKATP